MINVVVSVGGGSVINIEVKLGIYCEVLCVFFFVFLINLYSFDIDVLKMLVVYNNLVGIIWRVGVNICNNSSSLMYGIIGSVIVIIKVNYFCVKNMIFVNDGNENIISNGGI